MKYIAVYSVLLGVSLGSSANAMSWQDLWRTSDQQAASLLEQEQAAQAAELFEDTNWRGIAHYRAGHFEQALADFKRRQDADGLYNQGNALAQMGDYQAAIDAYDQAIELEPDHEDARFNRALLQDLLNQQQNQSGDGHAQQQTDDGRQQQSDKQASGDEAEQGEGDQPDQSQPPTDESKESSGSRQGDGKGDKQTDQTPTDEGDTEEPAPSASTDEDPQEQSNEPDVDEPQNEEPDSSANESTRDTPSTDQSDDRGGAAEQPQEQDTDQSEDADNDQADDERGASPPPTDVQEQPEDSQDESQSLPPPPAKPDDQSNDTEDERRDQPRPPTESEPATPPAGATAGDREQQQANEQWLNRVPDDPGGLLRQKFLRDHLRKQREKSA